MRLFAVYYLARHLPASLVAVLAFVVGVLLLLVAAVMFWAIAASLV